MIQSLERASSILHLFEHQKYWGISQISEQLGLNKSTTFGLVSTMEKLGLMEKDEASGKYCLGLELYRLGNLVDANLRQLILPELSNLVNCLEETINYVRPDGSDIVYLIKKESPHSMRICTTIGQRYPMYATGVGKAILAFLPKEQQEHILSHLQFHPYTSNTILHANQLNQELEQIRNKGYALDREELEYGLICVAVPVFDSTGNPIAALSCSGPKMRMTEIKIETWIEELLRSAKCLRELIVQT